ncbi:NAD-dependent epimerase/dehydratase family protein [Clostridium sediminicola]|uniref:NAD-dependent epimerase/dehydratase family protein n=1 Tax=Clostridium sediminicola TaxID=3114879 RepID=UPI0031F25955
MKVLITGGCGFIGSHLAERFSKEGHKIYIIDNLSTGTLDNLKIKYKFYKESVESQHCNEIFKTHKFDLVIHLAAHADIIDSINNPYENSKTNLLGLTNILNLSAEYKVKKFIFASSASVYAETDNLPFKENNPKNPSSPYAMSKFIGEYYCRKWKELYNLDTLSLRLSTVYGPRQSLSCEGSYISQLIKSNFNKESLTIPGSESKKSDYIYVTDACMAIYMAALSNETGVMNVSSNTDLSLKEVCDNISNLGHTSQVTYQETPNKEIHHSRVDNSLLKSKLRFNIKYTFEEGIHKTFEYYKELFIKNKEASSKKIKNKKKKFKVNKEYLPLIENCLIFMVLLALNIKIPSIFKNALNSYLDYNFLYIVIIAVIYGTTQGILSVIFSVILYLVNFFILGGSIVALMYDSKHLIHISFYIILGGLTGYFISKNEKKLYSKELELDNVNEKYNFLKALYKDTLYVKEELESQIINSKDSFTKLFDITQKLETLKAEEIFESSIDVIEKLLYTNMVSIYILDQKETYLRLKVKSMNIKYSLPVSQSVASNKILKSIINEKKLYINRNLDKNQPIMSYPLVQDGKVYAIISIYDFKFENLTLYYENLFVTVVNLISNSLKRAYEYEKVLLPEKYIYGTEILTPENFKEAYHTAKSRKEKYNINYVILKITSRDTMESFYKNTKTVFRVTDKIGLDYKGNLIAILHNISESNAYLVINRLKEKGYLSKIVKESKNE